MRVLSMIRLTVALFAATVAVSAQAWDHSDKQGIRKVIREQVQAMKGTDTEAFANTVSPGLRAQFPSAEAMYGILVGKIPSFESASNVGFGPLKTTDVGLIQLVWFADESGQPWSAMFIMEQQAGRWFVRGVQAKKMEARRA